MRSLPLLSGASAKALLAFMTQKRRDHALQDLLEHGQLTDASRATLETELSLIRTQGYACSISEVDEGVWGVSAPVFQQRSHAIAVVTLMVPSTRIEQKTQSFIHMTTHVAARISSRLQSH